MEFSTREKRCEDAKIEVVAQVGPCSNEEDEVRWGDPGIEVVEEFGCLNILLVVMMGHGRGEEVLTARKKSEMSCVMYTATPIYVKWNR